MAAGQFACGREHFQRLLQQRHFLDMDVDKLRALGESWMVEARRQLEQLVDRHWPGLSVQAVNRRIQSQHPEPGQLLEAYKSAMEAAHAFVVEKELLTLPGHEHLQIMETPVFLRDQIPFAAYSQPWAPDPQQHAWYFVTPAAIPELLAEHNFTALRHTGVHEAWPGHHVQFVTAHGAPHSRSLPRLLNAASTLYEGWALYCEQLMFEQNFYSGPEHEFVLLRDRLWRALRVVLDVDLHCGGLSPAGAAERMHAELGFHRAQAMADITWYTRAPSVPQGYATGWVIINAARDLWRREAPLAPLKEFHDRILASGSAALSLSLQRNFSPAFWQSVRERVCGLDAENVQ